jgi:chemotaxis protein methyltransferase CheR
LREIENFSLISDTDSNVSVEPLGTANVTAEARNQEFPYTETDFRQIKGILYDDSGIFLPPTKMNLVYSRLTKRLRALGLKSFYEYVLYVQGSGAKSERRHLVNALTTNLTHFFREPHHLDVVTNQLGPLAMRKTAAGERFRIWSAGCSTGEEPYSIALALLRHSPELAKRDVQILATDIDSEVVAHGERGAYEKQIVQPVEASLLKRYFQTGWGPNADRYVVCDDLRSMTSFKTLNLMQHWPIAGQFDAIFCRNVVIYFDEATKAVLWQRFAAALLPGAPLMIGHSERIAGPARELFEPAGLTAYRLRAR